LPSKPKYNVRVLPLDSFIFWGDGSLTAMVTMGD
jgi:hypothetical protein